MMSLIDAPRDKELRILEFSGGHEIRRRLLSLGFHKNDLIELDSKSILGGPVLVRQLSSETSVALGRGVAAKIMVEVTGEDT